MKISTEKPPIWDEVNRLFEIEEKGIQPVFTYGDTIYNPYELEIGPELARHEETHMEQQLAEGMTPELWWHSFIRDVEFRIEQEAEAYGAQGKLYCQRNKDRNWQARYLNGLAAMLSGEMYGNVITRKEAARKIREYAESAHGEE